jgi:hypothetical protein
VASLFQDMSPERATSLLRHPIHQEAVASLIQMIQDLRACRGYDDYHHSQANLLEQVLAVQGHRSACRRVEHRLRRGKALPADSPDLRSGADARDPESWQLEADVCERVERQFRSVGDALAWRLFG